MASEKYFPFRSISGDRKYSAEDWAAYFALFISNGVFYNKADSLKVSAVVGTWIKVGKGAGFIEGRMYILEDDVNITLDIADGALDRIDRVVLRCDYTKRLITIAVKKGSYSENPVAPELTRNSDTYELALADVYVAAGGISITAANITDQRLNTELCGIVTGLIDQADTQDLFNEIHAYLQEFKDTSQADFEYWFENVKEVLSEDAAGNLMEQIKTKASKEELNIERIRIDNIAKLGEGSTTGDAELQDIRVGVNGETYDNAGSAVRGQISDLKGVFIKIQDAEWYNGYFESWGEYKSPDSTYQEKYCYVPAVKGNTILFEYGYNNQHDSALCEIFECNDRKQQICGDTRVPPGDGKNYKFEYTVSNSETAYILIQFRTFGDILYKNVYITDYASFDYAKIIENELLQDLGGLSFSINSDDGGLDIVIKEE